MIIIVRHECLFEILGHWKLELLIYRSYSLLLVRDVSLERYKYLQMAREASESSGKGSEQEMHAKNEAKNEAASRGRAANIAM